MSDFFTTDTHFNHANIIRYCNRPFGSAEEMDRVLSKNWNDKIGPDDDVHHLGDVCFGNYHVVIDRLAKLNGRINIIFGNHDKTLRQHWNRIESVFGGRVRFYGDFREIKVKGVRITLCHYALRVWNKSHSGAWHLYGHSHGTLPDDKKTKSFDVGVDCHNYKPLSFEEVSKLMEERTFTPVDHHE